MASYRRSLAVSVLFTVFGGPGLLLGLGPWLMTRFRAPSGESSARLVLAAVLITAGLMPLFESIVRFIVVGRGSLMPAVPTEHLVVTGLYRYVRNPMYVGVLTALAGETVLLRSRAMVVYLAAVALAFHLFVCFYEEPRLIRTYPVEYGRYTRNVARWLPRLRPWRSIAS